jgi:hypothetical protein
LFRRIMEDCHVALPLSQAPDDPAVVIDDHGNDVFTTDPNGWRSDAEAGAIAAAIVTAVNVCGGFPPTRMEEGGR